MQLQAQIIQVSRVINNLRPIVHLRHHPKNDVKKIPITEQHVIALMVWLGLTTDTMQFTRVKTFLTLGNYHWGKA